MLTSDIENFPGYPQGIGGPEMMIDLRSQAERFGLKVVDKNVERVDFPRDRSGYGSKAKSSEPRLSLFAPVLKRYGSVQRESRSRRGEAYPPVQLVMVLSSRAMK